jgi:transcriptional regulator with XRE-family HTH domain
MTKNTSNGNKKKELSVFAQIRQKTNMSQEDLARMFGVSFTTVNRWENGHAEPKFTMKQIHTLSILLRGMGVDIHDLPDSPFGKIQRLNWDKKEEEN